MEAGSRPENVEQYLSRKEHVMRLVDQINEKCHDVSLVDYVTFDAWDAKNKIDWLEVEIQCFRIAAIYGIALDIDIVSVGGALSSVNDGIKLDQETEQYKVRVQKILDFIKSRGVSSKTSTDFEYIEDRFPNADEYYEFVRFENMLLTFAIKKGIDIPDNLLAFS
ncbi:MAG: hypothetical protein Q4C71_02565 [Microbacteriaceae bacterium]|nr:hypothetical protein [Microbacteriaceae bacterium]